MEESIRNRGEKAAEEEIEKDGAVTAEREGLRFRCMTVIGQIEGHYYLPENQKATKYEHMIPALTEAEQSEEIEGLLILLNTVGGDVEAGLALAELIAGMSKPTVSLVLVGGHSIGVPLAVAARRSFIVPSATMTLHPVRINGLVLGVPQSFLYLRRMQDRIVDFVVRHSRVREEELRRLILQTDELANDTGTIIDGREAVKIGLIDGIGGLSDALAVLKELAARERREKKGRKLNAPGRRRQ